MAQKRKKATAAVRCLGGSRTVEGVNRETLTLDCRQAVEKFPSGLLECRWGCLGLGSCVKACRLGAISINGHGAAFVDRDKCVGCGLCISACPKGLIFLVPLENSINAACSNEAAGPETRKVCEKGCIACGVCVKNCPVGAIRLEDNHAVIDIEECIACGMCAVKCPRGAISDARGIFAAKA